MATIEPAGIQDTYDLTVAEDHNFVADGLIVHNSHSAAYALVSYQTAYLKTHYAPEFMAALLSSEIEDGNKRDIMVEHIADARRLGVEVRPPHINDGDVEFAVSDGAIRFGLTAIKGVGRGAAEEIARARTESGRYRDLYDFCERLDLKLVNRAAIEKLIKGGAFDCLGGHRSQLFQALGSALQSATELQQDRRRGQRNFFDVVESSPEARPAPPLPAVPEWPASEKLKYEKEALDFYFSSHPLATHASDLESFTTHTLAQLTDLPAGHEVVAGGMMSQLRYQNTKNSRTGNTRYVRCRLEDLAGTVECVMWPDDFIRHKDEFQEDRPVFVKASIDRTRDEPILILTRVMGLEQGKRELARSLGLVLKLEEHHEHTIDQLAHVLRQARGGACPVQLYVYDAVGRVAHLKAGEEFRINPTQVAISELEAILGTGRARFQGPNLGRSGR